MQDMPCGGRQMSPWNGEDARAARQPLPLPWPRTMKPSREFGKTTENLVKIRCDGVAIADDAWRS